jgi:hypothetical protein
MIIGSQAGDPNIYNDTAAGDVPAHVYAYGGSIV